MSTARTRWNLIENTLWNLVPFLRFSVMPPSFQRVTDMQRGDGAAADAIGRYIP